MRIPKERLHGFVAATARRWRFDSRVTLYNHTGEDAYVDVLVRDALGDPLVRAGRIAELPNGRSRLFDVPTLLSDVGLGPLEGADDVVLHFSIVPTRIEGQEGPIDVELGEVFRLVTAQDHYIEHYDPATFFSSGVLYQTPPINDPLIAPKSSFIMQAPKVFLTEHRNTVFQVLHHSSDPDRQAEGRMLCRLRAGDGRPLLEWSETFPAHSMRYVDVKDVLRRNGLDWRRVVGSYGFLYFEAVSAESSFIPLTININERDRLFDMEHSLPPIYYGSRYGGARKGQAIGRLVASFQGEKPLVAASATGASRRPST